MEGRPSAESVSQEAVSGAAGGKTSDASTKEQQKEGSPIPSSDPAPKQSQEETKNAKSTSSMTDQPVDSKAGGIDGPPKRDNNEGTNQPAKVDDKAASDTTAEPRKPETVSDESKSKGATVPLKPPEPIQKPFATIDKKEELTGEGELAKNKDAVHSAPPPQNDALISTVVIKAAANPAVDATEPTSSEVKSLSSSQKIQASNEKSVKETPTDVPKTKDTDMMDVEMSTDPTENTAQTITEDGKAAKDSSNPTKNTEDVVMKDVEMSEADPKAEESTAAPTVGQQPDVPKQPYGEIALKVSNAPESLHTEEVMKVKEEPPDEAYDMFRSKKKKASKRHKAKLKIAIQGMSIDKKDPFDLKAEKTMSFPNEDTLSRDWWGDDLVDETWLDFYADPHSDQDPILSEREKVRDKEHLEQKLKAVDERDIRARKEVDNVITDLLKDKQETMERGIDQYRDRIRLESKKLLARLEQRYHERVNSNNAKINAKMKQLHQQHQNEMAQLLNGHRQQVAQRR